MSTTTGARERREQRTADSAELGTWLKKNYAVFMAGAPLKIGTFHELLARHTEIDRATLQVALRRHCGRDSYLKKLAAEGAVRLDLDGQPSGPGSPENRSMAAGLLAARKARDKAAKAEKAAAKVAEKAIGGREKRRPAATDGVTEAIPAPAPTPAPAAKTVGRGGRPIIKLKKSRRRNAPGGDQQYQPTTTSPPEGQ
jgi:sRNA-binding protein